MVARTPAGGEASHPEARAVPWRRALAWLAAGALAHPVALGVARAAPPALEAYARLVTPWVVRPLSLLGGILPFSVGEVAAAVYLAWWIRLGVRGVRDVARGHRRVGSVAAGGAARVALHLGVLLVAFNVLWGFHYARPRVEAVGGWPAWQGVGPEELTTLSRQAVEATNQAYLELHGTEDLGHPTPLDSWDDLEAALDRAWARTAPALPLGSEAFRAHGGAKRPWISPLLRRMGVAGMYFPFATEAWVVRGVPASLVSNTLAHEKAHQRGVAGEADAGFLAVRVGAASDHPHARYSAALYAQIQLMAALGSADREAWRDVAGARRPGVVRDLEDITEYWNRYRGRARAIRVAVNDVYLRAHGVRAGIADYGRTVQLLITWARLHDGEILAPGP